MEYLLLLVVSWLQIKFATGVVLKLCRRKDCRSFLVAFVQEYSIFIQEGLSRRQR